MNRVLFIALSLKCASSLHKLTAMLPSDNQLHRSHSRSYNYSSPDYYSYPGFNYNYGSFNHNDYYYSGTN